jgi:hypothetical protein
MSARSSRALAARSSRELLAEVLATHALCKQVGPIFRRRPPDEETASLLVEAFTTGAAPAWLAAYLLGNLRARSAYGVVRGILESRGDAGSESYAGVALAQIGGPDARSDLVRLLREAGHLKGRVGALNGLGALGDRSVVVDILGAVRERLVGDSAAGRVVAHLDVPRTELAAWLRGPDASQRAVAFEAARSLSGTPGGLGDVTLARAVREVLDAGTVKVAPGERRMLDERVDVLLRRG